jgi:DNA-binding transcriptional regulator YdaS (Cro superfamily)
VRTEVTESQQSYRRTLRYAEAIAGGQEQLARRLRVSAATMSSWATGWEEIPDAIFLSIVDIICEASEDEIRRARYYRPPLSHASRDLLSGNR